MTQLCQGRGRGLAGGVRRPRPAHHAAAGSGDADACPGRVRLRLVPHAAYDLLTDASDILLEEIHWALAARD